MTGEQQAFEAMLADELSTCRMQLELGGRRVMIVALLMTPQGDCAAAGSITPDTPASALSEFSRGLSGYAQGLARIGDQ